MEIRALVRDDESQVRMFWEVQRDAVAERPYIDHLAWHAARTYIPLEFPDRIRVFAAAWAGDRMIGTLTANCSTADNLHRAYADVSVLPDHRREGIGAERWSSPPTAATGWGSR